MHQRCSFWKKNYRANDNSFCLWSTCSSRFCMQTSKISGEKIKSSRATRIKNLRNLRETFPTIIQSIFYIFGRPKATKSKAVNQNLKDNEKEPIKQVNYFKKRAKKILAEGRVSKERNQLIESCEKLGDTIHLHAGSSKRNVEGKCSMSEMQ